MKNIRRATTKGFLRSSTGLQLVDPYIGTAIMFSKVGAFGTLGAFGAIRGWDEIDQLFELTGQRTTPLIQNARAEVIGRTISIVIQAALAIAYGGFLIGIVESGLQSDSPTTQRTSRVLFVTWACLVMWTISVYNGKLWHTTGFTRRCVYLVDRLHSGGVKAHAE
jgi:hypothetical protein